MKILKELTAEQESQLDAHADAWIEIGLSTEPIDKDAAENAFRQIYKAIELPDPSIRWTQSPRAAKDLMQSIASRPVAYNGGNLWCDWSAFESFFRRICGMRWGSDIDPLAEIYEALSRDCHIWLGIDTDIVASDRPLRISLDAAGDLHHETCYAMEYRDGWGFCCWHGTNFPETWLNGGVAVNDALHHPNMELRRVAAEMIGWDTVLSEIGAQIIDQNPDPTIGTLLEANIPDIGIERFLRVRCGTGRTFALAVPPETASAAAAQAYVHQFVPGGWVEPEVRT